MDKKYIIIIAVVILAIAAYFYMEKEEDGKTIVVDNRGDTKPKCYEPMGSDKFNAEEVVWDGPEGLNFNRLGLTDQEREIALGWFRGVDLQPTTDRLLRYESEIRSHIANGIYPGWGQMKTGELLCGYFDNKRIRVV